MQARHRRCAGGPLLRVNTVMIRTAEIRRTERRTLNPLDNDTFSRTLSTETKQDHLLPHLAVDFGYKG
jgi:hypothetical protein